MNLTTIFSAPPALLRSVSPVPAPDEVSERLSIARQAADFAALQAGDHDLVLRLGFLDPDYQLRPGSTSPILTDLMRTSSRSAVALKLALSVIWVAQRMPDHQTEAPAWFWAELLGLANPKDNGSRRIRAALDTLQDARLILTKAQQPLPTRITLCREDGSLDAAGNPVPYTMPDPTQEGIEGRTDRYARIPEGLWRHGWLAALRGAALTSLVLLIANHDFRNRHKPIWLSGTRLEHYQISSDTWQAGLRELEHYKLIEREVTRTAPDRYANLQLAASTQGVYTARTDVTVNWSRLDGTNPTPEMWRQNPERPQSEGHG